MNDPTSGLIDIIEPARPLLATGGYNLWLLILGVLTLMLLGLWVYWRGHRARVFRKRLHQLELAYAAGNIDQREAAYRLAQELQQGLHLQQLDAHQLPSALPVAESEHWAVTVTRLDILRYQAGARLDGGQWAQLFSHANVWLRRAGRC
ncbi:MAG: hypothetical protein V4563_01275 [Pseudomonadota bacterium]